MAAAVPPGDAASRLHSIAFGNVIAAAAKNLQQELQETKKKTANADFEEEVDLDDLEDDPELHALHKERLRAMMAESKRKEAMRQKGHGEYKEITEEEFLKEVRASEWVAVHFFHSEFPRCKVMDKLLAEVAVKHVEAKFLKIDAERCPFFVAKLNVKVLPCVVLFRHAVAFHRIVGFEPFKKGDSTTAVELEAYLLKQDFLKPADPDSDEDEGEQSSRIRSSVLRQGF